MSDVVVMKQPIVVKEPDRISVIAVATQGPAGAGSGTLDGLSDVDTTGVVNGNALVFDEPTSKWVPGAGGGAVASVNGHTGVVVLAASDVGADAAGAAAAAQAAAIAASQPVDSDLTAIAALTTTTFGRALLALADAAALRTAAGLGTAATANTSAFDAAGAAAAAQAASQPLDSDLTAIAALSTTTFGRALLALADAAALRTVAGLGTAATRDVPASGDATATQVVLGADSRLGGGTLGDPVTVAHGGTNATTASAARTNLGVAIGTDVEAHDADLTTIAGLTPTNDDLLQRKAGAWTNRTPAQVKTDLAIAAGDVSGLGTLATKSTVASADITDGTIVNADVNASAAIALSKLATIATARLLGNNTGSTGVPIELTAAQVKTLLAIASTDVSGLGTAATINVPVSVGNGGTGDTTLAAHGVLIGNGTSAVAVTGAGTATQVLTSNGASADPTFQSISIGNLDLGPEVYYAARQQFK